MGNKYGKHQTGKSLKPENEIKKIYTPFTTDQIVQLHGKFMMANPSGKLDKIKFTEMYEEIYPQGQAEKFCTLAFNVFDENHSGEIDFMEFLVALAVVSEVDVKKKLHFAFKMYDTDNNGTIDKKEMETIVVTIYDLLGERNREGDNEPKQRVTAIFNKLDRDHNGTLTEDEFVDGCAEDPVLSTFLTPKIII